VTRRMGEVRRALQVRGFRPLAASYAINELGDNLGAVALALLVLDQTGSALGTTALFVANKFLPALVAPALTAALDGRPVGRVLPALYVVEALLFGALALLAGDAFWLPAVLVLGFLDGTLALTGRALSRGAVAVALKPAGLLREGNSIINVAFAVTVAAGPAAGGVLVELGGAALALWLDAASFLAVAVLLHVRRKALPVVPHEDRERWLARLQDGLAYVRGHPVARRLVTGEGLAIVFFTLIVPIEVVYVERSLDAGALGYGLLLASWGAGIVLGSAVYARAGHVPAGRLIVVSTAVVGLGYAGLAVAPTLALACAASVLGGAGNGVQWVSVMTALQEAVTDDLQARVAGLLESVAAAAPGIGFVAGGLLTEALSPRAAYAVAATGVLLVAIAWARRPLDIRPDRSTSGTARPTS
jgi:MFS family permease